MTNQYSYNVWNPWTEKSRNIPFKTTLLAVGDGEQKLGAEFNVTPLGQNVSYDLNILGEKWEVKKMDSDNSFRLGVEVTSNYRKIIDSVIRILENIVELKDFIVDSEVGREIQMCIKDIESHSGRTSLLLIDGLRRNEVSASNLDKANNIIEFLKKVIVLDNKHITLYSSFDGKSYKYNILNAFRKLQFENIPIEDKLKCLDCNLEYYARLQLTTKIKDDIQTFSLFSLKEKLNALVRSVFTDIKLVLVHKDKGFKPINNMNLFYCNRITSGNPRCKLYDSEI